MVIRMGLVKHFYILAIIILCTSCTVKVNPVLETSLGMNVFERMKVIDQHDASIALYMDPKIKDLQIQQKIRSGEFSFNIGKAFSVKLIKALAYSFKTIHLVNQPTYKGSDLVNGLMRVTLQDVDVNLQVKPGWSNVTTEAYTRLSIRAEIQDIETKKTIWVGTTRAHQTGKTEEYARMTYQEAGRGFAVGIDEAIDNAIGDLIGQMQKSKNLQEYFGKWEDR